MRPTALGQVGLERLPRGMRPGLRLELSAAGGSERREAGPAFGGNGQGALRRSLLRVGMTADIESELLRSRVRP